MSRRTRILWSLLGVCLLVGGVASIFAWIAPPDHKGRVVMRELAAVADIVAFLFWMLVFAVYWATRGVETDGQTKKH